jgi:hypothetical protein
MITDNPYADTLDHDNEFDDSDGEAEDGAAAMSDTAHLVRGILEGSIMAQKSLMTSGLQEGGREYVVLHPKTTAKFRLAVEAMNAAHRKENPQKTDLLASLHKVVTTAHKAGNKSQLNKSIIMQWQVPDWAEAMEYNSSLDTMVPIGYSVAEQCD